ncbi:DUF4233 domain-containing protein [Microbacterium sp. Marseille-Q6965]|uniref:DUF4233 domain-containing protein n=1 Tax=Microbacterium sp. Marseille-Q6965 TaxID=2965072 RepID=UPI0021B84250|nr:DUF4233 domain-containing protein [Microbacterium sp. Marseille-Q6965]
MSRTRRYRTLPEKLGQVVLVFEAIVVFLGGLTVHGLKAVPEGMPSWWGIVAGSVVAVLLFVASGLLRWNAGFAIGWALQVVVALGALLVPAILLIALIFGGMWAYATIGGARIERRVSAQRAGAAD